MRISFQVCVSVLILSVCGQRPETRPNPAEILLEGRRIPVRNATQIKSLEPVLSKVVKKLQRELYPVFEEIIFDPEIPAECSSAFQKIMLGVQNFEYWAISFARSSGGFPSMLEGNAVDLGNYDACLGSEAKDSEGKVTFTGRYCTLLLSANNPVIDKTLASAAKSQPQLLDLFDNNFKDFVEFSKAQFVRIGICVPSTCDAENIEYAVEKIGGDYGIQPLVLGCRAKSEDPPLTRFQRSVICIAILLVALCLLGSYVDAHRGCQEPSKGGLWISVSEILRSFSIKRSWNSVFNFEVKKNEEYLACLHGLRALSAIYILWFHTYSVIDPLAVQNSQKMARWIRYDISFLPIYMGANAVETFFCISGAMAFRAYSKEFQKSHNSIFVMVGSDLFRRWIRLAIPSAALLGVLTITFWMASGPTKDFAEPIYWGQCVDNWWTIPTLLGNVKAYKDSCLLHLWYVGVDFQLRIFFLIPIIAMASGSKFGALGFSIAGTMGLISVIFISVTTFSNKLPPIGIPSPKLLQDIVRLYDQVQSKAISHFGSFAIGVCTMYIIELQRKGKMRMFPKLFIRFLWIVMPIVALINFYLPFYWQTGGDPWNGKSAFYAGLCRIIWGGGVSWIIYACATGNGGPINWLLTLRGLIPVSRLSFAFYLMHVFVLLYRVSDQRGYHEAHHYLQTITALGSLTLSLFFAFVFYSLVENPVNNLVNLMFRTPNRSKVPDVQQEKEPRFPELEQKAVDITGEKCYL